VLLQFAEDGEHEASRATLEQIVEISPDDPNALRLLEQIALRRGDADLRAKLDGSFAALATDTALAADHLASLAFHHEQLGRLSEAVEAYRGALARHAEHLPAIEGLGRVAAALQDHETLAEAKHRAAECTRRPERAAALLVEEADLRIDRLNDPDAGTGLLEQALRAYPDHEPAARRATEHLTSQGLFERLVEILSNAAKAAEDPERVNRLWVTVGTVYSQQLDNLRSAITALERAGKALPDDTDTLAQIADLYISNGQWNDAAKLLDKVVSLSLDDETLVAAHLKLADLWSRRLDDMGQASEHLDSVLTVDPGHPQALTVLAEIQRKSGQLDLALDTATRLAESTQGAARAAALVSIATIEHDRGNQAAFVDSLCAAVRLEGAGGEGSKVLRKVATDVPLGKAYIDALNDFIKSPGGAQDVESFIELARVQLEVMEMTQTAAGTLARGLEATGGASAIAVELARLLEAGGQHEEAAKYLSQALVRNATDADLWRAYAGVLDRGNRKLEARLVLAPIEALGRASEQERVAGQEARSQLAAPAPGVFGHQTMTMLAGGAMSNAAMNLLDALLDPIAKLFAPDLTTFGLSKRDRLPPKSMDSLRVLVDGIARSFGTPELELYASESAQQAAHILPTSPPTLVLSRQIESLPEREQAFVVARALAAIAGRFYPALSLSPERLERLFAAAGHGLDPGFGTEVAPAEELEQLAQQLRKTFSWLSSRKPFDRAVAAYVEAPVGDFARWIRKLEATAVCAAALVVADPLAAVRVMRREAGESAASGDPVGFLRGHPVALNVLQYWGSGNAFRVWKKVGMLR
jgi:tetratricopeptide (TPR) repeat protein